MVLKHSSMVNNSETNNYQYIIVTDFYSVLQVNTVGTKQTETVPRVSELFQHINKQQLNSLFLEGI